MRIAIRKTVKEFPMNAAISRLVQTAPLLSLLLFVNSALDAGAVDDFYRGRTVNVIVGYGPGGGYDLCAWLIARYLRADAAQAVRFSGNGWPSPGESQR
jgi:tripartite-type tricarboxylate transporter receptor subunit TctC